MDTYDLQARHAPVVFAFLPIILLFIALVPEFGGAKIQSGSIAFILLTALAFVTMRSARSAGRARQEMLYATWGGQPTTAMLRFRDTRLNSQTKQVYRQRLRRLGDAFPIPDEQQEQQNPSAADSKIGAAMDEVRRRAKERHLKSVRRENINYGAARNTYGLKPFGLCACAIGLLTLALVIAQRNPASPTSIEIAIGMGILTIAGFWLLGSTSNGVRHHAEAYALALFESIETLVPPERKRVRSAVQKA